MTLGFPLGAELARLLMTRPPQKWENVPLFPLFPHFDFENSHFFGGVIKRIIDEDFDIFGTVIGGVFSCDSQSLSIIINYILDSVSQ